MKKQKNQMNACLLRMFFSSAAMNCCSFPFLQIQRRTQCNGLESEYLATKQSIQMSIAYIGRRSEYARRKSTLAFRLPLFKSTSDFSCGISTSSTIASALKAKALKFKSSYPRFKLMKKAFERFNVNRIFGQFRAISS